MTRPETLRVSALPLELERALDFWQWCWDCGTPDWRCLSLGATRKCCPDCRHRDVGAVYRSMWARAEREETPVSRVRWRLSGSEPPPVAGDLLVMPLSAGQPPPPGWTAAAGGVAAYRTAIGTDDATTTGVLVVTAQDAAAEAASTAVPVPGGPPPVPNLAAWVVEEPPTRRAQVSPYGAALFSCPWCGGGGRYNRAADGTSTVTLVDPGRETVLSHAVTELTLGCTADRAAGLRRWRVVLTEADPDG